MLPAQGMVAVPTMSSQLHPGIPWALLEEALPLKLNLAAVHAGLSSDHAQDFGPVLTRVSAAPKIHLFHDSSKQMPSILLKSSGMLLASGLCFSPPKGRGSELPAPLK